MEVNEACVCDCVEEKDWVRGRGGNVHLDLTWDGEM